MKFALLMLALPLSAHADPSIFSGNWSGKGTYILSGDMTQCQEFKMSFAGSANNFEFVSGSRKCDKHSENFDNVKMEARDGVLYFYGQKVGEYDDKQLSAFYSIPEGGGRVRHWRMQMRRQGDHMMYEESRTMDDEKTPLISFAGLMILER